MKPLLLSALAYAAVWLVVYGPGLMGWPSRSMGVTVVPKGTFGIGVLRSQ